jgi:hypothetical protein
MSLSAAVDDNFHFLERLVAGGGSCKVRNSKILSKIKNICLFLQLTFSVPI